MDENRKESTPLQRYKELRSKSLKRRKRSRVILFGYTVLVVLTMMVYYNFFSSEKAPKSATVSSNMATMRITLEDRKFDYLVTVTVKSLYHDKIDLFSGGAVGDLKVDAGGSEISRFEFGTDPGANMVERNTYKIYTNPISKSKLNGFAAKYPAKVKEVRSSFLSKKMIVLPFSVSASLRFDKSLKTKINLSHEVAR